MKKIFMFIALSLLMAQGCKNNNKTAMAGDKHHKGKDSCKDEACCKDDAGKRDVCCREGQAKKEDCCAHDKVGKTASAQAVELKCSLGSPELQKRRSTVIEKLRKQIVEKKELPDGYAFKFPGTDAALDELTEFIKTERSCCGFFTFNLVAEAGQKGTWLELTGPEGVKDFINVELELY
jgi:hypothetical protein